MKQWLAGMLLPLSQSIYELALAVPMGVVYMIIFGVLLLLALWVLKMPPQIPEKTEGETISAWNDLRIFALVVLGLQALFYIIF